MGITKSCGHPRPPATSHNFATTTQDHPVPVIILPPPPTTIPKQLLFYCHQPQPPMINQEQYFSWNHLHSDKLNYISVTTAHPGEF